MVVLNLSFLPLLVIRTLNSEGNILFPQIDLILLSSQTQLIPMHLSYLINMITFLLINRKGLIVPYLKINSEEITRSKKSLIEKIWIEFLLEAQTSDPDPLVPKWWRGQRMPNAYKTHNRLSTDFLSKWYDKSSKTILQGILERPMFCCEGPLGTWIIASKDSKAMLTSIELKSRLSSEMQRIAAAQEAAMQRRLARDTLTPRQRGNLTA